MVVNKDDSSFLSWTATLHPESAIRTANMNPASLHGQHPLVAVYHEISADDTSYEGVPVAVPVVAVNDDDNNDIDGCGLGHQVRNSTTMNSSNHVQQYQEHNPVRSTYSSRPQPWRHSNLIDLIVGGVLALSAFIVSVKLELVAFILYLLAVVFHYLAEDVFGQHPTLIMFRSIFLLVTGVLMVVDSVLLMVNVLVTEILGAVALLLCTMFGGSQSGTEWHRFIRRTCHLCRWGIRSLLPTGWKPERVFPIPETVENASFGPVTTGTEDCGGNHDDVNYATRGSAYSDQHNNDDNNVRSVYRHDEHDVDDHTTISALTMEVPTPVLPTVTIPSEYVQVIDAADIFPLPTDGSDDFSKNAQQVVID